jgi:hypothetical protein
MFGGSIFAMDDDIGRHNVACPTPITPITLREFLVCVIEDGIVATKASYQADRDAAIAGFESCRGVRTKGELAARLFEADTRTEEAYATSSSKYHWEYAFREAVKWVAVCVSAVLDNQGLQVIAPPTDRAFEKAASILGVAGSVYM